MYFDTVCCSTAILPFYICRQSRSRYTVQRVYVFFIFSLCYGILQCTFENPSIFLVLQTTSATTTNCQECGPVSLYLLLHLCVDNQFKVINFTRLSISGHFFKSLFIYSTVCYFLVDTFSFNRGIPVQATLRVPSSWLQNRDILVHSHSTRTLPHELKNFYLMHWWPLDSDGFIEKYGEKSEEGLELLRTCCTKNLHL